MNRVIFGDVFEVEEVNEKKVGMRVYTHPRIIDEKIESPELEVVVNLFDPLKSKLLQFNGNDYHGVYHLGIFGDDSAHYVNLPVSVEGNDTGVTEESIDLYAQQLVEFIGDCQYGDITILVSVSNDSTKGNADLVTEMLLDKLGSNYYIVRPYSEDPQHG